MNKSIFRVLLILLTAKGLIFVMSAAFPARIQAQSDKRLTLGDLLRKAREESRGARAAENSLKRNEALPSAQLTFESRTPIDLNSVKPPRLSQIYNYKNQAQADYEKTLDLQINELYRLTQRMKNSANRGELWLRLAELYVEKAGIVDGRKQEEYDRKLLLFQNKKTQTKPVLDLAEAQNYNRRAIQLYEWFLRDFPKDSKVNQALFFLGYNYFELGQIEQGAYYYSRLTAQFPTSRYAGEAHFALGESHFEKEKWNEAYKEYAFLIKDNRHNLHSIALYKAAWCLYRLGKTEDGIQYLDYIVKSSRRAKSGAGASGRRVDAARLENEALKDLIVFFADTGDTRRAINYFRSVGGQESRQNIEKLAYYLSDKGNREGSREVFRYLIAQEPSARKNFEYQYQIVQNYFFSKNSPDFKSELYRWVTGYNQKSAWYTKHQADRPFIEKSNQLREQTLRNYILQQHQTAQNSRAAFSQQSAAEGYKLYFQEFPDSVLAGDMQFFYGELLYDMGLYGEAAAEYTKVVNKNPPNKYAEKASQNILLSIEKALPRDDELQKRIGQSLTPIPLDEKTEKFISTGNWYLQRYPKSDKSAEIKFRIGRLYYLTNNFDPAEKQFKEIVQSHPKTKFSEYSANLLLDIYNLKKDYAGLEKVGSELLADESIANAKLGQDIRSVLEKTSFKKAQDLEIEKKYLESAQQYRLFAKQNPKSELSDVALYNAGVNFERSSRNAEAIESYRAVVASNAVSSSSIKPKAKRLLAKLYQDASMFAEAAQVYRELAVENAEPSLTANFYYNSALMYELTGSTDEALKGYEQFLKKSKNAVENSEAIFKSAQLNREKNRTDEALRLYRLYDNQKTIRTAQKAEAIFWVSQLSTQKRQKIDLGTQEEKVKALLSGRPTDRSAVITYLAKIKLLRAEELFMQLKSVNIPNQIKLQKAAVDRKLGVMASLNNQLGGVIQLDSAAELVSALSTLGEANQHMAQSISAVSTPEGLSVEQRNQYLSGVSKITEPFQLKAYESFRLAVERGRELQIYNESYRRALAELKLKYPNEFYAGREQTEGMRMLSWGEIK